MIKKIATLAAAGMMLVPVVSAKEIASVNGKKVTSEEFKSAVESLGPNKTMVQSSPDMMEKFLNHLIDTKLLSGKAEEKKINSSEEYKSRLSQAQNQILASLYVDKYIEENTSDAALKKHFEGNKDKFAKKEIKASHILVKEEAEAKKILKEALKKGADFAELAKKHSTGPSGPKGGDLGWFGPGRMVPEFEKAALETPKGQVHPNPVKTQFGYHIIKVFDVKEPKDIKFDTVKNEVKETMTRDLRKTLLEDLRKAAKIEINKENLKNIKF